MKNMIIGILLAALVTGSAFHYYQDSAHQSETIAWQNKYAQTIDSMSVISTGQDSALVQMAQQAQKIKTENAAINQSLKDNKASLRYWATMAASYSAELDEYRNLPTSDSTIVTPDGDSLRVRMFDVNLGLIKVEGNFDKYDPWDLRFSEAVIDSISLKVGIAENKDGTWNTYITDLPPGFNVYEVDALVSPYHAPWYTNIHLSGDLLLGGPLGVGFGVGYGPWTGKIYGTSAGSALGVEYKIHPFKGK
jgi:hypothetical protein